MSDPSPQLQNEGQVGLEPDKSLAPPAKDPNTKVTEAPVGALFDSVGHHGSGTARYDEYCRAASDVVRMQQDLQRMKSSDVPTYAVVNDLRTMLDEATSGIFRKYEAYSVSSLSITLHDPGNVLAKGGHVYVCSCLDPDRELDNDWGALENLRTHDCQLAEFNGQQGMNYIYDVPLNKARFFTTPCKDGNRLSSPGKLAVMVRWRAADNPDASKKPDYTATPFLMTLTARVDFYCSTIRSDVIVSILTGGPGDNPLKLAADPAAVIEQPLSNKLIFKFKCENYPAEFKGDCFVYFVKPVPFRLDITLALSATEETEVVYNGFISMAEQKYNPTFMEVDISPLLNGYVGSDLTLKTMHITAEDLGVNYVVYAPMNEINILRGNLELWI